MTKRRSTKRPTTIEEYKKIQDNIKKRQVAASNHNTKRFKKPREEVNKKPRIYNVERFSYR